MNEKIAVAMSVYKNDKPGFLAESIESIINQTYKHLVLFIEVDGHVCNQVYSLLEKYNYRENVRVCFNSKNKGLAYRLNNIIDKVIEIGDFSYIARMDADDISFPNRLEKQLNYLQSHSNISVVGSDVIEITSEGERIFYKKMDQEHEVLVKNIIKKCPFNHPSVLFRISVFSESKCRYKPELKNTQDYYLWVDMIHKKLLFANLNEALLKFRIDNDFHTRRGFKKAVNDVKSRLYAFQILNNYSFSNLFHVFLLFILRVSPAMVKKLAYERLR
ncbi:glycosyl transferase [Vibrio splendidus]|nr:glycosyl transferase [Vibrio splendidus]URM14414.1 glycosyltransferase [Vibrio splendidus]